MKFRKGKINYLFSSLLLFCCFLALWLAGIVNAATIEAIETYGAFETAGITIKLANHNNNETARIWVNGTEAHPFIRYDGNHLATSLFNLSPGTTYNLIIEVTDPDGDDATTTTTVTTKSAYTIPGALNVYNVSSFTDLQTRINNAVAGDRIVVAAGTYSSTLSISGKNGTEANPVVITAADITNRPHFTNGVTVYQSSYLVFDHLEVEVTNASYSGGYGGMNFRGSHHITITNCYIHDCDAYGTYTANIFIEHNDENVGSDKNGYFLIMNNVLSDEVHEDWPWDDDDSCAERTGQTYLGIKMDFSPGGYNIICRNLIYGVLDAIAPGGDEGQAPILGLDDNDVLNTWGNRELDIYDNIIYHVRDDCLEFDGHLCNARVFRNRLGECQNAISTAPVYPGPIFITKNYLYGFKEGAHKFNTAVGGETRNVYWYNNTLKQHSNGQWLLYRGYITDGTRNNVFKNNIFMATGPVYDTDITGSYTNQVYDYNLAYSSQDGRRWGGNEYIYGETIGAHVNYATWNDFRNGTGQETNGSYGEASLSTTTVVTMPAVSYIPTMDNIPTIPAAQYFILNLGLQANSNGIDSGVPVPGITDGYSGSAPDCGASEYGNDDDDNTGGGNYDEWISIQNPQGTAANVTLTFMDGSGNTATHFSSVAATKRYTVKVNDYMSADEISTKVESDIGVIAERVMYWSPGDVPYGGGHCSVGVTTPATTWYLAEGATGGGRNFVEWISIQNPNATAANVIATFMKSNGSTEAHTNSIAGQRRYTIRVNDYVNNDSVATRITSDIGVVAERVMYWADSNNVVSAGGHCSIGAVSPALNWYLAEGRTGGERNFEEWISVQNPNGATASIIATFMKSDGTTITHTAEVSGTKRYTIRVNDYVVSDSVSTQVVSDIGVIAERIMYWTAGGISYAGGHCSIGATATSTVWYSAEGATGGERSFEEWISIQNPNVATASIIATFMKSDGTTITHTAEVSGTKRYTIRVNDYVASDSVSTQVVSDIGVVAERIMYWTAGGVSYADGHCSIGVTAPATTWYLAEGAT